MEGRITIDTPQEYLSGFEKKTAMLGRYKTTTDVNKAELYEELKHIIPGLTTSELDVYSEVIKYDPKQMKDFLKSIGKSPVLTKYLVNIRKPVNKDQVSPLWKGSLHAHSLSGRPNPSLSGKHPIEINSHKPV